jgi:hypothetical protein
MTLFGFIVSGCGEEATSPATPAPVDDQTPDTPPVQEEQALTPGFEIGQTWVVGSIYRSLSVKTPEDTFALDALETNLSNAIEIDPLMPSEVIPQDGTEWTSPVFWRFGVINTDYVPEDGPFHELATDASGQAQAITIIKVVAPKELNDRGISDGLDPVFYLVLRQSDWRVKGVHYNYKVREGRNTVVLELPEAGSAAAPGADMDFFLVDYMMPIFPLTIGDTSVAYGPEGASKQIDVRKRADDSVEVDFRTAIDNKKITQRWSDGQPWFDFSITDTRRSWRIDDSAIVDLLEANSVDFYSNDQFLESAETIAEKFRNRINLNDTLRVEAGTISSRTPDTNIPWAGYWFPLTDSATTFGWSGSNGRRLLDNGPATSIKSKIEDELRAIDALMAEILDMPKDAEGRRDKINEYYEQKNAIQTTIREHFEHPETGVVAKFRNGDLTLDDVNSFGPLEKYGLYLLANKVTDHPFEAAIWEITKQYNPGGESWWGKCNGWAAASILVNEPRETVTMQLDTANINGEAGNINVDFTSGDLKSLSASSYYGTRSHFYGSRYYGKDDDRGNDF